MNESWGFKELASQVLVKSYTFLRKFLKLDFGEEVELPLDNVRQVKSRFSYLILTRKDHTRSNTWVKALNRHCGRQDLEKMRSPSWNFVFAFLFLDATLRSVIDDSVRALTNTVICLTRLKLLTQNRPGWLTRKSRTRLIEMRRLGSVGYYSEWVPFSWTNLPSSNIRRRHTQIQLWTLLPNKNNFPAPWNSQIGNVAPARFSYLPSISLQDRTN